MNYRMERRATATGASTLTQATMLFAVSVSIGLAAFTIERGADVDLVLSVALFSTLLGFVTTLLWWGVSRPHPDDRTGRFRLISPLHVAGCYLVVVSLGLAAAVTGGLRDAGSALDDAELLGWVGLSLTGFWLILNSTQRKNQ